MEIDNILDEIDAFHENASDDVLKEIDDKVKEYNNEDDISFDDYLSNFNKYYKND